MKAPPEHSKQSERLESLNDLNELIRDGDEQLQALTMLAGRLCESPISVVSLVDFDQQYFVARTGLDAPSTPSEHAFCAHAIIEEGVFEVEDATRDSRFERNPLVTGSPDIRHYAGVPLLDAQSLPLGTLCVIDRKPRVLSEEQREILTMLASQAAHILRVRKKMRKLERDLAETGRAQRMTAVAQRLAHDVRIPLTGVLGLSEALATRALGDQTDRDVRQLVTSAKHLRGLLDDLLVIYRPGETTGPIPEAVDPRQLLADVSNIGASDLAAGVECRVEVRVSVPERLQLHESRMRRVLCNLLDNARKHTSEGEIVLEATWHDDEVTISVRDTGTGIEPARLGRIFEPFERGGGPGVGLGLAIVQELISQMGGALQVTSTVDVGTTFIVSVPCTASAAGHRNPRVGRRVYIAEDDPTSRAVLVRAIRELGGEPTAFPDGPSLLAEARRGSCDAVFVDYWMPGLTGPDVVRRLREQLGPDVVIVGCTGEQDGDVGNRFGRAGATSLLTKPFTRLELQRILGWD